MVDFAHLFVLIRPSTGSRCGARSPASAHRQRLDGRFGARQRGACGKWATSPRRVLVGRRVARPSDGSCLWRGVRPADRSRPLYGGTVPTASRHTDPTTMLLLFIVTRLVVAAVMVVLTTLVIFSSPTPRRGVSAGAARRSRRLEREFVAPPARGASTCRCGSATGSSSRAWRTAISATRSPRTGRCSTTSANTHRRLRARPSHSCCRSSSASRSAASRRCGATAGSTTSRASLLHRVSSPTFWLAFIMLVVYGTPNGHRGPAASTPSLSAWRVTGCC